MSTKICFFKTLKNVLTRKNTNNEIITTHELGEIILNTGMVPTSIYHSKRRRRYKILKNKTNMEIITTHELGEIILNTGMVPTPVYTGKIKKLAVKKDN